MKDTLLLILFIVCVFCSLGYMLMVAVMSSECIKYQKIKSMDKVTDKFCTVLGECEETEWLYTLQDGEKWRSTNRYYSGEKVCIQYK